MIALQKIFYLACMMSVLTLVVGNRSLAPYLSQLDRPIIAGHRGLSSLFPENTLESQLACMYQGADFIELDVVLNKDNELIVAHDTYLSVVSNIEQFSNFADRKTKRILDGKERDDWWIMDFTTQELKQLKIKQVRMKGRINVLDNLFTFPTMQESLDAVINFNKEHAGRRNADGNLVGILLESKDHQFHLDYFNRTIGLEIISFLAENKVATINEASLIAPLVLMSFDAQTVEFFYKSSDLPRVQLIKKDRIPFPVGSYIRMNLFLQEIMQTYATIIGADLNILWDKDTENPTQLVSTCRQYGLLIYGWTFQDDSQDCLDLFGAKSSQQLYQKAIRELQLDGIITEFSDIAATYAQIYRFGKRNY